MEQPPFRWVPGAFFLGVKQPGREADQSPPSSAEVKNAVTYTSTPQYAFMAWCSVKHRDNFTFTFSSNSARFYCRLLLPSQWSKWTFSYREE